MPIPTLITELSQTAASNYPQGSDSPATLDDTQRAHGSFIAMLRDGKGLSTPVTLASATTTDIGGQNSQVVEISGVTTITNLGTTYNGPRYLRFTGILTLTHNGTTLNLPGAANITTAAGDSCIAVPNAGLTGWNILTYNRSTGSGGTDYLNTTRIDVTGAATIDLPTNAPNTRHIRITGTPTITAVTVAVGQFYFVEFSGASVLTNNAAIVTNTGANITTAAGDTCQFRATAANTIEVVGYVFASPVVPASRGGTGYAAATRQLAQIQTFQTGAVATGTTTTPQDNTIPQITEGDQYMSLAITPTNASSTLEIEVLWHGATSAAGNYFVMALFRDAATNAVSAITGNTFQGAAATQLSLKYLVSAGSLIATTFTVRVGTVSAGTTTFNGISGGQQMAGLMASRITIKEYLP